MLSTCTEELISTPKIITMLPNMLQGYEKAPFSLNPIPYPEYLHLIISAVLVSLTAPNRQFSRVMSSSKIAVDFKAYTRYMVISFPGLNVILSSFK